MLPGGGCGAFRPGVSQPRDHMFILWALIEEQQRLIFMEKKIIKAGKGSGGGGGETGKVLVLVRLQEAVAGWGVAVPTPLLWGWAQCQGGWGPPGLCTESR